MENNFIPKPIPFLRNYKAQYASVLLEKHNAKDAVTNLPNRLEKLELELAKEKAKNNPDAARIARFNNIIDNLKRTIQRCQAKNK